MPQRRGTNHPNHKLDEEAVRQIRRRYKPGWISYAYLADAYGVSMQLIAKVVHRKAWAWVSD